MEPFDQSIDVFDRQYLNKGLSAQRRYPNESLIQFLASRYFRLTMSDRKSIRLLEVGCGSGANLWMMAKEGFSTHGMDSSMKGLDLAREHLEEKWGVTADLRRGTFTELPYENTYFDAVVDIVSLQHLNLKDSRVALSEIARVLKSGGVFFSYRLSSAAVMCQSSGGNLIDAVTVDNIADPSMPLFDNGPTSFWSSDVAKEIYLDIGFDLLSIERQGRTYENGAKYVEYLAITAAKPS